MNRKLHPLSGATYERSDDGRVQVVARSGEQGFFTREGRWLAGELRCADPHLCGWVAGPRPPDAMKAGMPSSALENGSLARKVR